MWKEHSYQVNYTQSKHSTGILTGKSKCYSGTVHVRPIIEYACTVWAPHIVQDIDKIKMARRRITQFAYRYNYFVSFSSKQF